MTVGEFINKRRKALNLTLEEVGSAVGVGKSTVRKWETGYIANIKRDKIDALAKVLNVSPLVFVQEDIDYDSAVQPPSAPIPPSDEFELVDSNHLFAIPMYESVAAGLGVYADSRPVGYDYLPFSTKEEAEQHMMIKVQGDSMYPKIEDGDWVVVDKQSSVESGNIAVVLINGEEGVVKKVVFGQDWLELHSFNPLFPTATFRGPDIQRVRIVGKVTRLVKTF